MTGENEMSKNHDEEREKGELKHETNMKLEIEGREEGHVHGLTLSPTISCVFTMLIMSPAECAPTMFGNESPAPRPESNHQALSVLGGNLRRDPASASQQSTSQGPSQSTLLGGHLD